jgi:ATP-binding cassette, subfamily B, bacterial
MMKSLKTFPFIQQHEAMDCGPACLAMIAKYHGYHFPLMWLREKAHLDREGVSLAGIAQAAEDVGFRSLPVKLPFEATEMKPGINQAPLPAIIHWNQRHFVVLYHVGKKTVSIADPAAGKLTLEISEFKKHWIQDGGEGIAMLFEPGTDVAWHESEANSAGLGAEADTKLSFFSFLVRYFTPYQNLFWQLLIGLSVGAVLSLVIPFVTQSIVDIGITGKDHNFLILILLGQFMLVVGQTAVQFIQNQILLHIGGRINIALISDFLSKLMRLPLSYFDAKNEGDLMQRVGDHQRIQQFLTRNSLSIVFSLFNFLVFGFVLLLYHSSIFLVFLAAAVLYTGWIWLFLSKRKVIDYKLFHIAGENHNNLTELVRGMAEIKLQNSQNKRKWIWTAIQARLFEVQMKSLMLTQYQDSGSVFINRLKDIVITFLAANLVIEGKLTLGAMLAIQYIVGQLNAPLEQFIQFIRTTQDARLSWDRVSEVHHATPEELPNTDYLDTIPDGDLMLKHVSHRYNELNAFVLQDIDLVIPRGKVTAIVGASGSGKTTLLKLIQGFYQPSKGNLYIGSTPLSSIRPRSWRAHCGSVAQDGFIFSGSIAQNIGESDAIIQPQRLKHAIQVANIESFIASLPLGTNTKIGAGGNGISTGQRQRMLIARAVYKNPDFLFFDEATNALDAKNESVIVRNLDEFFEHKTVIIVAHRLSTVCNADQIIVLDQGRLVEQGTHNELVAREGFYYQLIKNQLELGQ